MSRSAVIVDVPATPAETGAAASGWEHPPLLLQYAVAALAVAAAVVVGLGMQTVVPVANLTLLFVLPVTTVAILFGWGPSLFAALAGALAFDFFFTEPKYSLTIASPADVWSTGLLLLIGAIVSTVAAQARHRALQAQRAADQAEALQNLAHAVVAAAPRLQILESAAKALHILFGAPAVILAPSPDGMEVLAKAGRPMLSPIERRDAAVALDVRTPTHAGAYPTDRSRFDYWPVVLPSGEAFVIGVDFGRMDYDRPEHGQGHIDAVTGYLAAAFR
jgi:two-component system sensor histidine kinase KdpD